MKANNISDLAPKRKSDFEKIKECVTLTKL